MRLPFDTHFFPDTKGVYIVGGSVRDLLAGRTPVDYDLAVEGNSQAFALRLADRLSARVVELGKPGQTVQRVIAKECFFDILPVAGGRIEEDLGRRDFTINAMALELASRRLIDPLGGQRDLAAGKIRMVSAKAFRSDPVRLIRAFRLAAVFGLQIEEQTTAAIIHDAPLIRHSAAERIRDELFKILQQDRFSRWLGRMAETGLLFAIFPELEALQNCRRSAEGGRDLFARSLEACRSLEKLLDPRSSATVCGIYPDKGPQSRALLKMALLLHNIGQTSAQGRTSFSRLAGQSAASAGAVCRRLRFSRRQAETVGLLIRNHARPYYMFRARRHKTAVQKALIHLFIKCDEATDDVLLCAMAVFNDRQELTEFFRELLQHYQTVVLTRALRPPLLTGEDLITEFGLKPSALFARILRRLKQESLLHDSLSRQQALDRVAEWLQREKS